MTSVEPSCSARAPKSLGNRQAVSIFPPPAFVLPALSPKQSVLSRSITKSHCDYLQQLPKPDGFSNLQKPDNDSQSDIFPEPSLVAPSPLVEVFPVQPGPSLRTSSHRRCLSSLKQVSFSVNVEVTIDKIADPVQSQPVKLLLPMQSEDSVLPAKNTYHRKHSSRFGH